MDGDDFEIGFTLCSNCGDFVLKDQKTCTSCNKPVVHKIIKSEKPKPDFDSLEPSPFICLNCGAFIGLEASHCSACGTKREPLRAKIDVSSKGHSNADQYLETSPSIFLCDNCGAFLSSKAVNCVICGVEVQESDEVDEAEDVEEQEYTQETERSEPSSDERGLLLCHGCGAFVSGDSPSCGVCGISIEDIKDPFHNKDVGYVDADSKLSSTGVIFICHECGAFIGEHSKTCSICGIEIQKGIKLKDKKGSWTDVKIRHLAQEIPEVTEKTYKKTAKIGKKIPVDIIPKRSKAQVIKDCSRLLYKKAMALKKLGKYKESIKSLSKALSLDKENKNIILAKADIYYEMGQHKQAAKLYTKLLESESSSVALWNRLGNALLRMGNQKESLILYEKALSLDANNKEALINKGYILMRQEKYEEALKYAEKIMV